MTGYQRAHLTGRVGTSEYRGATLTSPIPLLPPTPPHLIQEVVARVYKLGKECRSLFSFSFYKKIYPLVFTKEDLCYLVVRQVLAYLHAEQ